MAISSISSLASSPPHAAQQTSFRQSLQQLAQALQSGNLSSAQQAYASLSELQSNGAVQLDPSSPLAQTLNQVGKALQAGNLTGAQQAFAALQQQVQSAQGTHHHRHHHHGAASESTPSGQGTVSDPTASSTPSSSSGLLNIVV